MPSKPVSEPHIAAIEFSAVKELRLLPEQERRKMAHSLIDRIRPLAAAAAEVIAMEKQELVGQAAKDPEVFSLLLRELAKAVADAEAALEVIRSAEIRVASSLATIKASGS
jgi:hypothetical protein